MQITKLPAGWEETENTIEQQCACRFCGQMQIIRVLKEWPEEMADEEATRKCKCDEAKKYRYDLLRKERADKAIDEKFNDEYVGEEQRDLLRNLAGLLINESLEKVTITFTGKIKASLSLTAKGNVKIKRTAVEEASVEV